MVLKRILSDSYWWGTLVIVYTISASLGSSVATGCFITNDPRVMIPYTIEIRKFSVCSICHQWEHWKSPRTYLNTNFVTTVIKMSNTISDDNVGIMTILGFRYNRFVGHFLNEKLPSQNAWHIHLSEAIVCNYCSAKWCTATPDYISMQTRRTRGIHLTEIISS